MKKYGIYILFGLFLLSTCSNNSDNSDSSDSSEDSPWTLNCKEDAAESCGYVNQMGEVMIDHGKYSMYFTDTFDKYAIVIKEGEGMVAINKNEDVLYQVFVYDNGPDYPSDGYFRIIQDQKIGYADAQTGEVKISPAYPVAKPFENNYAPICPDCGITTDGDHAVSENGKWGLIDKGGQIVVEPMYDDILEISDEGKALVVSEGEEKWVEIR